jgi:rhamnulokinase
MNTNYLAVDLGAESGRVMVGKVGDGKLALVEVHRFSNGPIDKGGSLRWDFDALLGNIKTGLAKAVKACEGEVAAIGVDTWGVDYGLVDENGKLVGLPYCYRDSRNEGKMEKAAEIMGRREIYESSGIQFMPFNTVYQFMADKEVNAEGVAKAAKAILIPDLVSYMLCGEVYTEYTIGSTTGLMDMRTGKWSEAIFEKLGLDMGLMPEVRQPCSVAGKLNGELAAEFGCGEVPVVAVGAHDTASAVAAVPAVDDRKWAYLSSGTWSLMGVEVDEPVINDATYEYSFTNEGGVCGTIRLLKNIMGLWLVQQCRKQWMRDGEEFDYGQLADMASKAEPFKAVINTNDVRFLSPGDMPLRINEQLRENGYEPVEDKGQMIRIVLESLAFNYRWVVEKLEEITGEELEVIHIVGGGIKNKLLCQLTADAAGREVVAGPAEATASGNVLAQAMATGQVESLSEARKMVGDSFDMFRYEPHTLEMAGEFYEKFLDIFTP